jgi:hypothetical protein
MNLNIITDNQNRFFQLIENTNNALLNNNLSKNIIKSNSTQKVIDENNDTKKNTLKNKKIEEVSKAALDINYIVHFKNPTLLQKFKLFEVKHIAKKHGLKFSGTKKILIERINDFFLKTLSTVKIQSIIRRWFVLFSIKNRGPAFKNRSICTNDTDFVSLEPITEIPNELFYSYKDTKGFTYGFNISSLIDTLKIKGILNNPYNRELINEENTKKIIQIYNICFIIYPDFQRENVRLNNKAIAQYLQNYQPTPVNRMELNRNNNGDAYRRLQVINRNNENQTDNRYENITMYSTFLNINELTVEQEERIRRLNELRNLSISQRINNLFIEIDSLGNYTQARWFENLTHNDYILLYRTLYDIWYFQGNIERTVRHSICPFQTPFYNINHILRNRTNYNTEQMKEICLITFENLVYTGINDDHRKLGALHALTALTVVSIGARMFMPWLYESVAF